MKKDIAISIIVGSIVSAIITLPVMAEEISPANKIDNKSSTSSCKCASGKCGTEKIYGQAKLKRDPQDQLVRARDGKCGLSGYGINNENSPQRIGNDKCVNGICGK